MQASWIVGIGLILWSGSFVAGGGQPAPQLAEGPGKDVIERVCGECHEAAARIVKLKKSENEWVEVITDMQNRGMTADDKDLEVVLAYLTKHYGPSPEMRQAQLSLSH